MEDTYNLTNPAVNYFLFFTTFEKENFLVEDLLKGSFEFV